MPPIPRVLSRAMLAAWLVGAAALLVGRSMAGPAPAVASLRNPGPSAGTTRPTGETWSVLHLLYAGCRCSEGIFTHLFERRPLAGATERIVLVADANADAGLVASTRARAVAAGFTVETVDPGALVERFGVEGAPLLVVADGAGRVRYAGGYADPAGGPKLRDTAVIADLMEGRSGRERPPLAYAASQRLEEAVYARRTGAPTPRN